MKKRIRSIIFGFLAAVLLCTTVFAAPVFTNVQIAYNNIKIVIDGEEITPKDVRGNVVDPFIMDGTTYLPVRAIGEALGLEVEWNRNINTVFLTTPLEPLESQRRNDLEAFEIRGVSHNILYEENQSFKMLGNDYIGYTFANNAGGLVGTDCTISTFYNLNGQYTTIRGTLGRVDGTGTRGGIFTIYLDDELYTGYTLSGTMPTYEIIIDVTGIRIMRIEVSIPITHVSGAIYGFGNVTLE